MTEEVIYICAVCKQWHTNRTVVVVHIMEKHWKEFIEYQKQKKPLIYVIEYKTEGEEHE